jgi:ribulose-phosphate 3-epimerase
MDGPKNSFITQLRVLIASTPVYVLEEVLDYIDGINVLMVNPGFAGQKIVPSTIKKVEKVVELLRKEGRENIVIEADGNITPQHALMLSQMGASMFVCGSSSIFIGGVNAYRQNVRSFREVFKGI